MTSFQEGFWVIEFVRKLKTFLINCNGTIRERAIAYLAWECLQIGEG